MIHHHNTGVPFGEKLAMRDGVTTPLELEVGAIQIKELYSPLEGNCRLNYGFSSGTMPARESIFNAAYKVFLVETLSMMPLEHQGNLKLL